MSSTAKGNKPNRERVVKPTQTHNGKSETPSIANKVQSTTVQISIAQMATTDHRSDVENEMMKKVTEISDLTGRTKEDAYTALHDCNGDANQAVEFLLEKKDADQWQEKKKKKKPSAQKGQPTNDSLPLTDTKQFDRVEPDNEQQTDNIPRGRRDKAPPRFQKGRGRGANVNVNGEKSSSGNNWERSGDNRGSDQNRGRRRGAPGGNRGRSTSNRGGFPDSGHFESGPQIEMWTNDTAQNGKSEPKIGAWNEVNEEFTADDWSGSLEESLVLTPSTQKLHQDGFPSDSSNNSTTKIIQKQQQSFTSSATSRITSGDIPATLDSLGGTQFRSSSHLTDNVVTQNALSAGSYDRSRTIQKPTMSESFGMVSHDQSTYLSHYTKEATECIKNAVGIGSSGDGSHGVTNLDQLGRSSSQATSASSLPNSVKLQQQQQQQQQHRSRLPPPSKIPSSAVEMPGSVNSSQLDVQFGNWDNPTTVADSFAADSMPSSLYSGTSSINMTSSSTVQHVPNNAKISTLSEMSSTSLKSQADQQQQQQQSQQHQVSMLMDNHGIGSVSQLSSKTTYPMNEYNAYLASNTEVKDLGNAKVLSPSQSMSFACSQVDKKHPAQQQVQTSTTSQLTFNQQLPYSADSSSLVYRASSTGVENMSGFTQPSLSQGSLVAPQYGTSSLGYDATSSLTHPMYTVTQGQTQFPYQRFSQNFSATTTQAPYSVGGQSQQQQPVPTGSSMSTKQQTGTSYPSSLSQGYDSSGINPYQGMAYQSGAAAVYPGNQLNNLSYQDFSIDASSYQNSQVSLGNIAAFDDHAASGMSNYQNQMNQMYRSSQQQQQQQQQQHAGVGSGYQTGIPDSLQQRNPSQSSSSNFGVGSSGTNPNASSGKILDSLSKLSVSDSTSSQSITQYDSLPTATSALTSTPASSTQSATVAQSSLPAASKVATTAASSKSTAPVTSNKTVVNLPPGVAAPLVNPNYMIGQPPGFHMTAYGYPPTQQYTYEDLQLLQQQQQQQQRFAMQTYYDVPFPTSTTLAGRDASQGQLTTVNQLNQQYPGTDVKLTPVDPLSPPAVQPTQSQPQAALANQQYPTIHPGYGYYYPGTNIVPMGQYFTQMIPMGGMAVPVANNAAHGVTTSTTQYQKPAMYGSLAYGVGGQNQDFSKTFTPQTSIKTTLPSTGVTAGDVHSGAAFGKTHIQGFDKSGFHSGTPPPFGLTSPPGAQQAVTMAPTVYGQPYVPMMPHQQSHSQILHHGLPQDSSTGIRGVGQQQNLAQSKVVNNKSYNNSAAYWNN